MSQEVLALNHGERGLHLDAWGAFLERYRPDILLASELESAVNAPTDWMCRRSWPDDWFQDIQKRTGGPPPAVLNGGNGPSGRMVPAT